jgi:hypothetical protein
MGGLLFCECVNKSRKEYFKYISSMLDEIFFNGFDDMSKYMLTKKFPTCQ